MSKKKSKSYSDGKRWGFAVAKSSLSTGNNSVYKVDKAMRTCYQNASTGKKKLNMNERQAYRGIADGMYDAIRLAERVK